MILVELPPPTRVPEAYCVVIAPSRSGPRYFTLERSLETAVVAEWTAEGRHVHLGPCEASALAFLERVRACVGP